MPKDLRTNKYVEQQSNTKNYEGLKEQMTMHNEPSMSKQELEQTSLQTAESISAEQMVINEMLSHKFDMDSISKNSMGTIFPLIGADEELQSQAAILKQNEAYIKETLDDSLGLSEERSKETHVYISTTSPFGIATLGYYGPELQKMPFALEENYPDIIANALQNAITDIVPLAQIDRLVQPESNLGLQSRLVHYVDSDYKQRQLDPLEDFTYNAKKPSADVVLMESLLRNPQNIFSSSEPTF